MPINSKAVNCENSYLGWKIQRGAQGEFTFPGDDILYEIDHACVQMHYDIQGAVFSDASHYHKLNKRYYSFGSAGIDSDNPIGKDDFIKAVNMANDPDLNQYLYLHDIYYILGSLQSRIVSSSNLLGLFFESLSSTNSINIPNPDTSTTVMIVSGVPVQSTFSHLYALINTMYSILDQISRLAYEIENLHNDFTTWPKLKSINTLYGDSKHLHRINKSGTVFQSCKEIMLIQNLRHELIHCGALETNQKIFVVFSNDSIIERFVLLPDTLDGILVSAKNRKRFFSTENKANDILVELCNVLWSKIFNTLTAITAVIRESTPA